MIFITSTSIFFNSNRIIKFQKYVVSIFFILTFILALTIYIINTESFFTKLLLAFLIFMFNVMLGLNSYISLCTSQDSIILMESLENNRDIKTEIKNINNMIKKYSLNIPEIKKQTSQDLLKTKKIIFNFFHKKNLEEFKANSTIISMEEQIDLLEDNSHRVLQNFEKILAELQASKEIELIKIQRNNQRDFNLKLDSLKKKIDQLDNNTQPTKTRNNAILLAKENIKIINEAIRAVGNTKDSLEDLENLKEEALTMSNSIKKDLLNLQFLIKEGNFSMDLKNINIINEKFSQLKVYLQFFIEVYQKKSSLNQNIVIRFFENLNQISKKLTLIINDHKNFNLNIITNLLDQINQIIKNMNTVSIPQQRKNTSINYVNIIKTILILKNQEFYNRILSFLKLNNSLYFNTTNGITIHENINILPKLTKDSYDLVCSVDNHDMIYNQLKNAKLTQFISDSSIKKFNMGFFISSQYLLNTFSFIIDKNEEENFLFIQSPNFSSSLLYFKSGQLKNLYIINFEIGNNKLTNYEVVSSTKEQYINNLKKSKLFLNLKSVKVFQPQEKLILHDFEFKLKENSLNPDAYKYYLEINKDIGNIKYLSHSFPFFNGTSTPFLTTNLYTEKIKLNYPFFIKTSMGNRNLNFKIIKEISRDLIQYKILDSIIHDLE